MKPKIFIGSSTEGLEVAKRIKEYFSGDYDCYLWNDNIFKNNTSFLETLVKAASLFDFGFMVFSADDKTIVRDKHFETARDNVLFEYGLFLGRMGVERAFIISQDGVKIPSDMLGITRVKYNVEDNGDKRNAATKTLEDVLGNLKKQIDENVHLHGLGLLPSTVIAYLYFDNFVKVTAEWIVNKAPALEVNGKIYKRGKLKIKMPDNLEEDIKRDATVFYKSQRLSEYQIETAHRNYMVHYAVSTDNNTLEIYDMPTILNGLYKAIDIYFHQGFVGKTEERRLAEGREMRNFYNVLQYLINNDAYSKGVVEIIK